jgi:hypothetical protein
MFYSVLTICLQRGNLDTQKYITFKRFSSASQTQPPSETLLTIHQVIDFINIFARFFRSENLMPFLVTNNWRIVHGIWQTAHRFGKF